MGLREDAMTMREGSSGRTQDVRCGVLVSDDTLSSLVTPCEVCGAIRGCLRVEMFQSAARSDEIVCRSLRKASFNLLACVRYGTGPR